MSTGRLRMSYPKVRIRDETMREGMQIESVEITVEQKVRLIDQLSRTGLKNMGSGYVPSPKFTPQMKDVDEIMRRFTPVPGVTYSAGAPNAKGRERRAASLAPPPPRAQGGNARRPPRP